MPDFGLLLQVRKQKTNPGGSLSSSTPLHVGRGRWLFYSLGIHTVDTPGRNEARLRV